MSSTQLSDDRPAQIFRALILTILLAFPGLICLKFAYVFEADIWWHLSAGQWILAHHAFPHTDPFSSFGANQFWAAYSWLFELLALKLYQSMGLMSIVAYSTVMLVAVTAAIYRLISRLLPDFNLAALLTMVVLISIIPMFSPRPWLFTILFFTLETDILMQARKSGKIGELLWLPPLFALWANIHIQFVNGLLILGVATIEPLVERFWPYPQTHLRLQKLWPISAACILATFANPYGWRIYQVAFQLATQKWPLDHISEMHAIEFRNPVNFLLLFLTLAAVGALAWSRRFPFFETTLLAMAAYISFRSERDIWFLAILAGAILASLLPVKEAQQLRLPLFARLFVGIGIALVLWVGGIHSHRANAHLHDRLAEVMPVRAVEFIQQKGYSGPLFNDHGWGGYLIWSLGMPVSIDGRAGVYGDDRLERSAKTWNAAPDWASDPNLMAAKLVVAPIQKPLTQILRLDSRFHLVYQDKTAAVFVR